MATIHNQCNLKGLYKKSHCNSIIQIFQSIKKFSIQVIPAERIVSLTGCCVLLMQTLTTAIAHTEQACRLFSECIFCSKSHLHLLFSMSLYQNILRKVPTLFNNGWKTITVTISDYRCNSSSKHFTHKIIALKRQKTGEHGMKSIILTCFVLTVTQM